MGIIYKSIHISLERIVAIKMIHPKLMSNNEIVKNFYNEARIQASLNHPNIVAVYDFFDVNNKHYVVMEYVNGESISKIINHQGFFDTKIAISIFRQILEGLNYAHSKNVIHKDIKTSNFLLTPTTVKITDFGIAQILGESSGHTTGGSVIGTPKYMSPEQILGKEVDKRSDIYSLGITLYEFLTGTVPFTSNNSSDFEIRKSQVESAPRPPSELNNKIPKELEKIILKSINKDPDDRFQSIDEFIKAIEEYNEKKPTVISSKNEFKEAENKNKSENNQTYEFTGTLKDTSFAEILSFLYYKKSSGSLLINSIKNITIYFDSGFITFIEHDEPSLQLGEILVKTNKITTQECSKALDFAHEEGLKIGESLIKLEKITHHELSNILESQIKDKLQSGFFLNDGFFGFKTNDQPINEAVYQINPLQIIYENIKIINLNSPTTSQKLYNQNIKIIPSKNIQNEVNNLKFSSPKEIKLITNLNEGIDIKEFFEISPLNKNETANFLNFLELSKMVTINKDNTNKFVENENSIKTKIMTDQEIESIVKNK